MRKSESPLLVGSVASQSTRASAARLAGQVAVASAVTQIWIAYIVTIRALGFEVVNHYGKNAAGSIVLEGLGQGRAVLGVEEARVNRSNQEWHTHPAEKHLLVCR